MTGWTVFVSASASVLSPEQNLHLLARIAIPPNSAIIIMRVSVFRMYNGNSALGEYLFFALAVLCHASTYWEG